MSSAPQTPVVDQLFDVKNAYYIGNFQQCINEAQKAKVSTPSVQVECEFFLYRSYIAQKKYLIVIDEIKDLHPVELRCLKFLAEYFSSNNKNNWSDLFSEKFDSYETANYFVAVVAGTIYINEEQVEKALKVLCNVNELETISMMIQIYLKMNRIDLARKELIKMQEKDEDSTLTQLAQAWINIASGQDKLQDAYYIFQELIDKYGSTASLLNAQAVCFINQQKYEEAESALQESMAKDSNNCDTLINLITLSGFVKKQPEIANRYLMQLKDSHTSSQFVKDYQAKESEFDKLCHEYEVPVP